VLWIWSGTLPPQGPPCQGHADRAYWDSVNHTNHVAAVAFLVVTAMASVVCIGGTIWFRGWWRILFLILLMASVLLVLVAVIAVALTSGSRICP
jgi:ABC-type multidrug transport system permease subunit